VFCGDFEYPADVVWEVLEVYFSNSHHPPLGPRLYCRLRPVYGPPGMFPTETREWVTFVREVIPVPPLQLLAFASMRPEDWVS